MTTCCVCGAEFRRPRNKKRRDHHGGKRRRSPKNKTCSRSCSTILSWQRPGAREDRAAAISRSYTDDRKRSCSELQSQRWSEPGARVRQADSMRTCWSTPGYRERASAAMSKSVRKPPDWSDPTNRDRMLSGISRACKTDKFRRAAAERMKKTWRENRNAMIANVVKMAERRRRNILDVDRRPQFSEVEIRTMRGRRIRVLQLARKLPKMSATESARELSDLVARSVVVVKRYPPGPPMIGWKPTWLRD